MVGQPARALVDLAVDAEVDHELHAEVGDDAQAGVGKLAGAVAAVAAAPLRGAPVGGRIPAQVTPVECALERKKPPAFVLHRSVSTGGTDLSRLYCQKPR